MDILQYMYKVQRYTPEEVAALSPALQEAWRIVHAAALEQRAIHQAFVAMPKRSKATREEWKAHDARAATVNRALQDAWRLYIATMDAPVGA